MQLNPHTIATQAGNTPGQVRAKIIPGSRQLIKMSRGNRASCNCGCQRIHPARPPYGEGESWRHHKAISTQPGQRFFMLGLQGFVELVKPVILIGFWVVRLAVHPVEFPKGKFIA